MLFCLLWQINLLRLREETAALSWKGPDEHENKMHKKLKHLDYWCYDADAFNDHEFMIIITFSREKDFFILNVQAVKKWCIKESLNVILLFLHVYM